MTQKNRHLCTITQLCRAVFSQVRHVLTIRKKNLLNSNSSSTCPHNMAHFGPLMAEIRLGHPNKFQRVSRLAFVTAATSVTGGQPDFARCLAVSWADTLYTFSEAIAPWQNFVRCKIYFTFKSCVCLYWQRYCTALQQRASAKLCGVVQGMEWWNFHRGRHLYTAGRPSRWASAHILVFFCFVALLSVFIKLATG